MNRREFLLVHLPLKNNNRRQRLVLALKLLPQQDHLPNLRKTRVRNKNSKKLERLLLEAVIRFIVNTLPGV